MYGNNIRMNPDQLQSVARHNGPLARTGACGPTPANVVGSWGGACPVGNCRPDDLPAELGRYFAGDRGDCKEMPYAFQFVGQASGTAVVVNTTSILTMCPTRLVAVERGTAAVDETNWVINSIVFGNQNQIVNNDIIASAFRTTAKQSVPLAPACLMGGTPVTITCTPTVVTAPGDTNLFLVFFGPAIG